MSQENVEIVQRGIEAAQRTPEPDWATMRDLYHPDHEFISRYEALEGGSRRGERGYRDWLLHSAATMHSEQSLESVTDIDDERVLAITPSRNRGDATGIELDTRFACIVTVHGGKIARTEVYHSSDEALKAVGLTE